MKLFKNFLKIWGICLVCCLFPFLTISLVCGAPAATLAAISLTLFFNKELS